MPVINGTLTDFGLDPLEGMAPSLTFRAASPGIAGMNILTSRAVEAVPASNGYFEVDLASTQTIAPATHYVVTLHWTETTPTRRERSEVLPWKLFVPPEGGPLGDLLRVEANPALVYTGTEAPSNPANGTWWLDPETGDLSEFSQDGVMWQHKANLRGPAGYNATNAAEDDAAVAAFIKSTVGTTATKAALLADFASAANGAHNPQFGTPQHEDGATYTYPNALDFGPTVAPPLAKAAPNKGIDFLAHWYNDFGLSSNMLAAPTTPGNGANGWYGWGDWKWNFPTNTGDGVTTLGYDQARHPIQGFYKGDNPDVLGWQCYWLAEAGVTAVALTQSTGFSSTNWNDPASKSHWVYQLFTNVPNFKALKYVLSLKCDGAASNATQEGRDANKLEIEAQNDDLVNIYKTMPGAYTYSENGKTYAVVSAWDTEKLRGVYDNYNGQTNTVAYLKALAAKFKAAGFDGMMFLARVGGVVVATPNATLKPAGAYVVGSEYETRYGTDASYGNSYATYAANVQFPTTTDKIVNVVTSAKTAWPHGSAWKLAGSTPALFHKVLARAVDSVVKNKQKRIITIYNVSEWAEGGPGLIPNKKDGWGYLDAIRAVAHQPRANTEIAPIVTDAIAGARAIDKSHYRARKVAVFNKATDGATTVIFTGTYSYLDNKNDYVFGVTLECDVTPPARLTATVRPDFGGGNIYVKIFSDNTTAINGYVNLWVDKITP